MLTLLSVKPSGIASLLLPDELNAFNGTRRFHDLIKKAGQENWARLEMGQLVGRIGLEFLGTPYVSGTLELSSKNEVCSANLLELDCVTFFETALGLARLIKTGGTTPTNLLEQLEYMRYRQGELNGYTSRLHYASEWMYDNMEKPVNMAANRVEDDFTGVVDVITKGLSGARSFDKHIDFMSTHPKAYKQLKSNPEAVSTMEDIEKNLNSRTMHYIPKELVKSTEEELSTGDIIAITTSIKGLDISHTGLCFRDEDGKLRLLHASLTQKKVIIDTTLHEYLAQNRKQTGIMVARPQSPTKGS